MSATCYRRFACRRSSCTGPRIRSSRSRWLLTWPSGLREPSSSRYQARATSPLGKAPLRFHARSSTSSPIVDSVRELGLDVRAGLHTGECEVIDGKVAGIAVHTGARVASLADAGEVLVSSTVKDLVAGSGIKFADRGTHELKGVGEWLVYALLPET
jgi:hypothetical protein